MSSWIWQSLVRHLYCPHELARRLRRDVRDIASWCQNGALQVYAEMAAAIFSEQSERCFAGMKELPAGWIPVAQCDGGTCDQREWIELADAPIGLADARELDRLGYGILMQRASGQEPKRVFTQVLHLLPGRVNAQAAPNLRR